MNCIICADKISCRLLEEFVGKTSSLNLVGTYNDSVSARNQLSEKQDIDLIFLDIELPKIDVINDIIRNPNDKHKIIIVSSGEQNTFNTSDFNVIDYLPKPVTYQAFCKAVDKAIRYYSRREVSNNGDNEIFIKKGSSLVRLKLKDIIYIEALENYLTLNTKNEKFTVHFAMKAIESQLPSVLFIRVHRSFIVNRSMIKSIKENSLELKIGDRVENVPVDKSLCDPSLNGINLMAR